MARNFEPDHEGLNQIARSPEVRAALVAAAEKAKAEAIALSEDFRTTKKHPHYADSFNVVEASVLWKGDYPGGRGAALLMNSSDHALEVEFGHAIPPEQGGGEVAGHHVLGRVLGAMGRG